MEQRAVPEGISEKRSAPLPPADVVTHRPLAGCERALPVSLDPCPQPAAGRKPRFLRAVPSNVTLLQA